jgi:hypothetical protein
VFANEVFIAVIIGKKLSTKASGHVFIIYKME